MRQPLQPTWDLALKHWDEVLSTPADYAACVGSIAQTFEMFVRQCEWQDEWDNVDVLLAAFWYRGYADTIPGLAIGERIASVGAILLERSKSDERYYR